MSKEKTKIKKSYEALKEWHKTNTEKGVTTLPEFLVKDCLGSIEMLEKALYKACNRISTIQGGGTVDYWKERFLKDADD